MKSLYEGILDDIETSVGRMDSDIEKVHIFEWLEYNAVPHHYETLRPWTRNSNGKFSTYAEWNEVTTINPDKSVSFKCGIELLGNNKTKAEKVPFKIHSVDGNFLVGSPLLKTSENFPDIVDSVEFAHGIKIKVENWHVKVKNLYRSNKALLHGFPFSGYDTNGYFPCIYIRRGPVFGKNVIFECLRKSNTIYDRPIIRINSSSVLSKVKLINIPYVLLSDSKSKIMPAALANKRIKNMPDTKLITSSKSNLYCELLYDKVITRSGILIKQQNGEFEEFILGKKASSNDLDKILANIKMENKHLL